jgi:RNA polymerase sigma-70 factor (ECF subfamily)
MAVSSPDTRHSLLERAGAGDPEAWRTLLALYEPLLRHWLRASSLQPADQDDLVQQVLYVLARKLPAFQHNGRPGAFRAWLRSITLFEAAEFHRRRAAGPPLRDMEGLDALPDPIDELARLWDAEYERHVLQGLLRLIEPDFTSTAWQVFRRVALDGASPRTVAEETGLTVNAVTLIKSRTLRRLRQQARGLVD